MVVESNTNSSRTAGQTRSNIIEFYDVTDIDSGGATSVFDNTPLFSVFLGYEFFQGAATANLVTIDDANSEDVSAMTVNPANGTLYLAGFDNDLGSSPNFPFSPIPPGRKDDVGDTTGDYDIFRVRYQELLNDFEANDRPAGTVYAPAQTLISGSVMPGGETFISGLSIFDGVDDDIFTNLPHPEEGNAVYGNGTVSISTVHVGDSIQKIGEVTRAQLDRTSTSDGDDSFFDHHLEFVNPETLVFLDGWSGDANAQPLNGDHQIRIWKRESTSPGALPLVNSFDLDQNGSPELVEFDADGPDDVLNTRDDYQGGFNGTPGPTNSNVSETWTSTIAGELRLDGDDGGTPARPFLTDVTDIALVNQNGVVGVWVAEFDEDAEGNDLGDQVAFYEFDFSGASPTATKKEIFASDGPDTTVDRFNTPEDPTADPTTADGDVDFLFVDGNGNLVIGESGFDDPDPTMNNQNGADFDDDDRQDPANEPRIITLRVADYNSPDSGDAGTANEILPAQDPANGIEGINDTSPWTVSAELPIAGANDDDNEVTDIRIAAIDKATGYIYIIEQDIDNAVDPQDDAFDDFHEDIYVFDPATGTIVYHEVDAIDGGFFDVGQQFVFVRGDITGDGEITYDDILALEAAIADPTQGGTVSSAAGQEWYDLTGDELLTSEDLDELVQGILGLTDYVGDFNLDGVVDEADLNDVPEGWAARYGEAFDGADFLDWQRNFGSNNMAPDDLAAATVPEPTTLLLLSLGVIVSLPRARGHRHSC